LPTWGLIVEQMRGVGDARVWEHQVVAHVDGTREQAMEALRGLAMRRAADRKRARLYRSDDGYVLVVLGWARDRDTRFSIAELVWSSEPVRQPEPDVVPEPQDAAPVQGSFPLPRPPGPAPPPEPDRPWDADVPDRPSWLGRDDLP
jgi:hypothetical protein